jgi:hypothetical protein
MPASASSTGGTISFQLRPGEKDDRQAGRQHQQRGAQVGLLHDQPDRHRQQHAGHQEIERAQLALALLEPPGQHQRHGDLQDFAGLDDDAHVQPAPRALLGDAETPPPRSAGHARTYSGTARAIRRCGGTCATTNMMKPASSMLRPWSAKRLPKSKAGRIHGQQADAGQQEHAQTPAARRTPQQGADARRQSEGRSKTEAVAMARLSRADCRRRRTVRPFRSPAAPPARQSAPGSRCGCRAGSRRRQRAGWW